MEGVDIKTMDVSRLRSEIRNLKAQMSLLLCQLSLGALKDTASIRKLRRSLARYCTVLSWKCKHANGSL